ncbi:hypothetical protein D3C77_242850 [compost metagenome]
MVQRSSGVQATVEQLALDADFVSTSLDRVQRRAARVGPLETTGLGLVDLGDAGIGGPFICQAIGQCGERRKYVVIAIDRLAVGGLRTGSVVAGVLEAVVVIVVAATEDQVQRIGQLQTHRAVETVLFDIGRQGPVMELIALARWELIRIEDKNVPGRYPPSRRVTDDVLLGVLPGVAQHRVVTACEQIKTALEREVDRAIAIGFVLASPDCSRAGAGQWIDGAVEVVVIAILLVFRIDRIQGGSPVVVQALFNTCI